MTDKPQPTSPRRKRTSFWVWLARILTLAGMASNIVPTLIGLAPSAENLRIADPGGQWEAWELAALRQAAEASGVANEVWSTLAIGADLFSLSIFWTISLLLFWRYSDRWIGWLIPFILTGLGVGVSLLDHWFLGVEMLPAGLAEATIFLGPAIWPAFMVSLFLFPDGKFVPRWTRIPSVLFVAFYLILHVADFFFAVDPAIETVVDEASSLLAFGMLLLSVGSQIYRFFWISTPAQRQQTKWVTAAVTLLVLSFALPQEWITTHFGDNFTGVLLLAFLPRVLIGTLLPIAFAASITRYRLWDLEGLINQAVIYGLLTTVLAAVFGASTVVLNQVLAGLFGAQSASLSPVVSAVLVATIFQPTRKGIEERMAKRFNPNKADLSKGLAEASPEFWGLIAPKDLHTAVVRHVAEKLGATPVALYLPGANGALKLAEAGPAGVTGLPAQLALAAESLQEFTSKRVDVHEGYAPFTGLAPLYVPERQTLELRGVLAFGPRANQRGYSGEELKALYALGGQVGTALLALELRQRAQGRKKP